MLIQADSTHLPLRPGYVDLAVTSPPYYELVQYGGNSSELGHEPTPALYVDALLAVMDELRRLRVPIVAVNIGDSYAGSGGPGGDYGRTGSKKGRLRHRGTAALARDAAKQGLSAQWPEPQSLCLTPELFRIAASLGYNPVTGNICHRWVVRSVVIWAKNALPRAPLSGRPLNTWESVTFFVDPTQKMGWKALKNLENHEAKGNVWVIPPARGKEAHGRASWPVELPRRIIEATGAKRILDPFHGQGNTERAVESFPGAEYYGIDLYKPESLTRL